MGNKTLQKVNNDDWYVNRDLLGYRYNQKYPPNFQKYGSKYSGYPTVYQETFFYDFAVQYYDVRFRYHGIDYFVIIREQYCARADNSLRTEYESFPDAIALIEQLEIEGKKLIDIIDEIEEVEVL